MASKRRIEVQRPTEEERAGDGIPGPRSDRDIAIEGTWKEWFQMVFLKYCYAVGILFLACTVPLEVLRQLEGDLGLGVAFVSVLLIVPLGFFGYLKLWGEGGLWGSNDTDE